MGNQPGNNAGSGAIIERKTDAERLAGMLASVEAFCVKVDAVRSASLMAKAPAAESALAIAAELLRSMALITHEYAGRAAQLENRIIQLEGVCYGE